MSLSILYILPEILLALGVIVVMFSGLFYTVKLGILTTYSFKYLRYLLLLLLLPKNT